MGVSGDIADGVARRALEPSFFPDRRFGGSSGVLLSEDLLKQELAPILESPRSFVDGGSGVSDDLVDEVAHRALPPPTALARSLVGSSDAAPSEELLKQELAPILDSPRYIVDWESNVSDVVSETVAHRVPAPPAASLGGSSDAEAVDGPVEQAHEPTELESVSVSVDTVTHERIHRLATGEFLQGEDVDEDEMPRKLDSVSVSVDTELQDRLLNMATGKAVSSASEEKRGLHVDSVSSCMETNVQLQMLKLAEGDVSTPEEDVKAPSSEAPSTMPWTLWDNNESEVVAKRLAANAVGHPLRAGSSVITAGSDVGETVPEQSVTTDKMTCVSETGTLAQQLGETIAAAAFDRAPMNNVTDLSPEVDVKELVGPPRWRPCSASSLCSATGSVDTAATDLVASPAAPPLAIVWKQAGVSENDEVLSDGALIERVVAFATTRSLPSQAESEATPSEVYREHVQDLLRAIVAPNGPDRSVPVIATPSVATVEASEQEDQEFADAQESSDLQEHRALTDTNDELRSEIVRLRALLGDEPTADQAPVTEPLSFSAILNEEVQLLHEAMLKRNITLRKKYKKLKEEHAKLKKVGVQQEVAMSYITKTLRGMTYLNRAAEEDSLLAMIPEEDRENVAVTS